MWNIIQFFIGNSIFDPSLESCLDILENGLETELILHAKTCFKWLLLIRAFISYQNIQEKSIILENSIKFWLKSQAEALATELPIKRCVFSFHNNIPAGSTTSACSSLGFCLNFMLEKFKMAAVILNILACSSAVNPRTWVG